MSLSLTEDADTFEAAMHFVDAYVEADATSSEHRSDDDLALTLALDGLLLSMELKLVDTERNLANTTTKRTAKRRVKRPASYNPNHARSRQRKDLLHLREKFVELEQEQELKVLQSTRPLTTQTAVRVDGNNRSTEAVDVPSLTNFKASEVWKETASHQVEQRLKSERENHRLKVAMEIGKSLHKLLQATSKTQAGVTQKPTTPLRRTKPTHRTLTSHFAFSSPLDNNPKKKANPSNSVDRMQSSKTLVLLGLLVVASSFQVADARPSPAGMTSRRQLGSYNDYGRHRHKHDHDHKKNHHRHDHDHDHSHYRRRLEDKDVKDKATESSDYSYGKDDYKHDDYEHKGYGYDHDHNDYDYKGYGGGFSYGYKSYGGDCDDYGHDKDDYSYGKDYYSYGKKGYDYYPDYYSSYGGGYGYGGDVGYGYGNGNGNGYYPDYYSSYSYGYPSYPSYPSYPGYGYDYGFDYPYYGGFGYESATSGTGVDGGEKKESATVATDADNTKSVEKESKSAAKPKEEAKSESKDKSKGK